MTGILEHLQLGFWGAIVLFISWLWYRSKKLDHIEQENALLKTLKEVDESKEKLRNRDLNSLVDEFNKGSRNTDEG